jgi:hypothetical protein
MTKDKIVQLHYNICWYIIHYLQGFSPLHWITWGNLYGTFVQKYSIVMWGETYTKYAHIYVYIYPKVLPKRMPKFNGGIGIWMIYQLQEQCCHLDFWRSHWQDLPVYCVSPVKRATTPLLFSILFIRGTSETCLWWNPSWKLGSDIPRLDYREISCGTNQWLDTVNKSELA